MNVRTETLQQPDMFVVGSASNGVRSAVTAAPAAGCSARSIGDAAESRQSRRIEGGNAATAQNAMSESCAECVKEKREGTRFVFTVPGEPKGKGRPKFARRGAFTQAYTPAKTVEYENLVRMAASEAMEGNPPIEGPVSMVLIAICSIPNSWSKKKQASALAGEIYPTGKPDLDNLQKSVLDGMNKIVFGDDSQVVLITAGKLYGDKPGVSVTCEALANA